MRVITTDAKVYVDKAHYFPQKLIMEKTKSILKQNGKENELGDIPSSKSENILFAAATCEGQKRRRKKANDEKRPAKKIYNKNVNQVIQCYIRKKNCSKSC